MKKILLVFVLLIVANSDAYPQLEANTWMFNTGIRLQFLPNFTLMTNVGIYPSLTWGNSCVSLSEGVHGRLLLYGGADPGINPNVSPTMIINDARDNQMHSEPLHGTAAASQGCIVLPSSENCRQFIVVGVVAESSIPSENGTIAYNILDRTLNNGLGDIVKPYNRMVLRDKLNEGFAATIQANKKDYFIVGTLQSADNRFFALPVNATGPDVKKIIYSSDIYEKPHLGNIVSISPNSKYLYSIARYPHETSLYSFDNFTGRIRHLFMLGETKDSQGKLLSQQKIEPGAGEFTHDSKHLYVVLKKPEKTLLHIDIEQKKYELISFMTPINHVVSPRALRLAPDTSIYFFSYIPESNNWSKEIGLFLLRYRKIQPQIVEQIAVLNDTDINGTIKSFTTDSDFPHFSRHIYDPNFKRASTVCDIPKIMSTDTVMCTDVWSELFVKYNSISTENTILWQAEGAEIKQSKEQKFRTKFTKSGHYPVTVKVCNINGCDSVVMWVKVQDTPKAQAGENKTICRGEGVILGINDSSNLIYEWNPKKYIDNPQSPRPICTPDTSTTYTLTVTNSLGCTNSDTVTIFVGNTLSLDAGNDTTVCVGSKLILKATGDADEYEWSPKEYFDNPKSASPRVTLDKSATLYLQGKKGHCTRYDSINVTITNGPTISIIAEKQILCASDTIMLMADGAESYEWSPAELCDNPLSTNPRISTAISRFFYVTGKTAQCVNKDSIFITVDTKPELTITGNRDLCYGESTQLLCQGADSYEWIPNIYVDNNLSSSPVITPKNSIEYTIRATKGVCTIEKIVSINVNTPKELRFQILSDDTTLLQPSMLYPVVIHIPQGSRKGTLSFHYDNCCVSINKITIPEGIILMYKNIDTIVFSFDILDEKSREISLECMALLPPDGRMKEEFSLEVSNISAQCMNVKVQNNNIRYDPTCAWQFRGVAQTSALDIVYSDDIAYIKTGYGGDVTLSVINVLGEKVWSFTDTFPASDIKNILLPKFSSGIYILRVDNGVWHKDKLIIR
ncbi:MAG: hypothetical protein IPK11_05460 [Ignavibacteria bacterium]|nr:hypothetical protein [Ignavibacteria bacterium]